jgi:hypothetical protein
MTGPQKFAERSQPEAVAIDLLTHAEANHARSMRSTVEVAMPASGASLSAVQGPSSARRSASPNCAATHRICVVKAPYAI